MINKRIARQVKDIATKLEAHFGDMYEFEFTVQDGRLYVLHMRPGKRSPEAAIRIATDLFLEGLITGKTMLERISPSDIADSLRAKVRIDMKAPTLGEGIPASGGAAAGMVAFTSESVLKLIRTGNPVIFAAFSYAPEDIEAAVESSGMVAPGGMTSHAAMVCRGMGKPCVVGLDWSFHPSDNTMITPAGPLKEGDYVTVDGNSGRVFAGLRDLHVTNATDDERLMLVLKVIDALASTEELPYNRIGTTWRVRDLITRGGSATDWPDPTNQCQVWPTNRVSLKPHAYLPLDRAQAAALGHELLSFAVRRDDKEYDYLWLGLRRSLQRFLLQYVGSGRHPSIYRPLFDPCDAVLSPQDSGKWNCAAGNRVQLVGEEYFSINHYAPDYLDVESIRIYWATACRRPQELWRIDATNPDGEKLLEGAADILALKVVLNDGVVPLDVLPRLYNYLRGRQNFLSWYDARDTSGHQLKDLLLSRTERPLTIHESDLLRTAGLLTVNGELTKVGLSLLQPTSAKVRATQNLKMGW